MPIAMFRPTVLLVSPPVLYAPTWWSSKVASKPHLHSLAGFIRDIADSRIVELDVLMGPAPREVDAFLERIDELVSLEGIDLVGISCWTSLHYLGALAVARKIHARRPELPIDPALASDLRLLEQLQAPVEGELPRPVRSQIHAVPSTSTRPDGVTRTWTLFSVGSAYGPVGRPSDMNFAGWHGQARCPLDPSHQSSHGKCEQIEETAVTWSPRRKR